MNIENSNCDHNDLNSWGLTGIVLRDYQLFGVNWILNCITSGHGGILSDEMGLGKTIQAISAILATKNVFNFKKILIVAPLSVINNWKTEISSYTKLKFLVYIGSKVDRCNVRKSEDWKSSEVIITTYEYVMQDEQIIRDLQFDILFVDEGHRLKNIDSVLSGIIHQMSIKYKFLLTGTPIQNNLDEFYNLLMIVSPKSPILVSRSSFKKTIETQISESASMEKLDSILNNSEELRHLVLRRTKLQELSDLLPEKKEVILFHGLNSKQKLMYKSFLMKDSNILKEILKENNDSQSDARRLMNTLMQIRKCVLHPYLFPGVEKEPFELGEHIIETSQKMVVLDKLLGFLIERGHKMLIFSQMTKMLDIIQDYCTLRELNYERLDGSVRSEERFAAISNFDKEKTTRIFLLSTRAGGQGLNLTAADTVIFIDGDFNPQVDLQAMARIHRPGQNRPCRVIRLIARDTVEEMILSRAQHKLQLTRSVLGHEDSSKDEPQLASVKEILCYGIDNLFSNDVNLNGNESDEITTDFLCSILGNTDENGSWISPANSNNNDNVSNVENNVETVSNIQHIYQFEGVNYAKKATRKEDYDKVFDILNLKLDDATEIHDYNNPRINKRMKVKKETYSKHDRKIQMWKDNNYKSYRLPDQTLDTDSDSGSNISSDNAIQYVVGDVTKPLDGSDARGLKIICHVVDNSGSWGSGGVFSCIDRISQAISLKYLTAFEMDDLHLGDSHIFSFTDHVELALLVAQKRDKNDRISAVQMHHLERCLSDIGSYALKNKASVHLPRIGYKTPKFNWYGVERVIAKYLSDRGVETYIYYYRRNGKRLYDITEISSDQRSSNYTEMVSPLQKVTKTNNRKSLSEQYFSCCFGNCVIYFDDSVSRTNKQELMRYIYAGGGLVTNFVTGVPQTTHVIYEATGDSTDNTVSRPECGGGVKSVSVNVLQKFIEQSDCTGSNFITFILS